MQKRIYIQRKERKELLTGRGLSLGKGLLPVLPVVPLDLHPLHRRRVERRHQHADPLRVAPRAVETLHAAGATEEVPRPPGLEAVLCQRVPPLEQTELRFGDDDVGVALEGADGACFFLFILREKEKERMDGDDGDGGGGRESVGQEAAKREGRERERERRRRRAPASDKSKKA